MTKLKFIKKYIFRIFIILIFFNAAPKYIEPFKSINKTFQTDSLMTIDGEDYNIKETSLFIFWATWCGPCHTQIRLMNKLPINIKDNIVLVNSSESKQTIKKYMEKNKIRMTSTLDRKSKLTKSLNVYATPTLYLVGKNKMIKYSSIGFSIIAPILLFFF